MAVPNPQEFFNQAEKLIAPPDGKKPTQVDLRRAVSAAYYGLFHAVAAAAADQYVGRTDPLTGQYALAYRSLAHRRLNEICKTNTCVQTKYQSYVPTRNFGPDIQAFAVAVCQLQEKRHKHDYDPLTDARLLDARLAVEQARAALQQFYAAAHDRRALFLGLLLFEPCG